MSGIEIIVLVALGTGALLVTIVRGPFPDPRLVAEPLSTTVRNVAFPFAYFLGASLLLDLLPGHLRPPAAIAIMTATLVMGAWWYRRHPFSRVPVITTEALSPPIITDEPVGTTADWIKALVVIGAIVGTGIVLFMVGTSAFCGCGTRPAL